MSGAAALGAFSSAWGNIVDLYRTLMTNQTNMQMNRENIDFQRDWNQQMYGLYNNEFEYNKALQQQLFEREDTAISRQAADMARIGLNPLSQQMNGLGAGQAVGLPNPVNGKAPQNTFSADYGINYHSIVAGALEAENAAQQIDTAGVQRDKLRAEENYQNLINESQKIDNLIKANKNGVTVDKDGNLHLNQNFRSEQDITESNYKNNEASRRRNEREDTFQENFGAHDLMSQAGRTATDVAGITYRAAQGMKNAVDSEEVQNAKNAVSSLVMDYVKEQIKDFKDSVSQKYSSGKKKAKDKLSKFLNAINNFGNQIPSDAGM